jgi:hypothetical protein
MNLIPTSQPSQPFAINLILLNHEKLNIGKWLGKLGFLTKVGIKRGKSGNKYNKFLVFGWEGWENYLMLKMRLGLRLGLKNPLKGDSPQ